MNTPKTSLLAIIASLVACAAASAQTTTFTTLDGNGQDSRVQYGSTDNRGTGIYGLVVKDGGNNNTATYKTYLGFDLSTWNTTAASASLTLTFSGNVTLAANTNIFFWGLNEGSNSWSEDTIIYSNAPAADSDPGNGSIDDGAFFDQGSGTNQMTLLGSVIISESTAFTTGDTITFSEISLANFINNFNSDNLTIGVTTDSGQYTGFYANNTATSAAVAPTLTLTSIPEPATAGSVIGALAIILSVLRRRNLWS